MCRFSLCAIYCGVAVFLAACSVAWANTADNPRIATFSCDVTPPLGQPMFSCDELRVIEQPLLAKGVIIEAEGKRYVLCAVDYCELCNGSHQAWRELIAAAAGTEPALVAVQTVHQHTAPLVDIDAQKILGKDAKGIHVDLPVLTEIEKRLSEAVAESVGRLEPFDQVGVGQAKVDRVASSRRARDEKGVMRPRYSGGGTDPAMRELPEGRIDPFLKTITFARAGKPLARLHYYATHPQTRYGDNRATSDFVGEAREKLQQQEGVFQVYFNGCGGDITVGKYNDKTDQARAELAQRLLAGMQAAVAATKFTPVGAIAWRVSPVSFPRRNDPGFNLKDSLACANNLKISPVVRLYQGAVRAVFHQRSQLPIELSSLQLGNVFVVNLPGEALIDFQFFAQQLKPGAFVAVAAYGDCGTGYICPAKEYGEGYEPSDANAAPESELLVKQAIAKLLDTEWKPDNTPVQ